MTTPQKGRIFISYRRADSAGYAGRIYDRLTTHFGVDAVFMDVDTIEAGLDFVVVLQNAVQSCDVLAALIGRRWLDSTDTDGKRRLDNPEDFVRVEIAAALSRDIRVIPVLVDGTIMPRSTELPDDLKPLARRNALQVNHHSFNADAQRLISQLELAMKAAEDSKILKAKALKDAQERAQRQAEIESLLKAADLAIELKDWKLAQEKINEILKLNASHADARGKLNIVQRKITELEQEIAAKVAREKEERARAEREEKARIEKEAREKAEAEERARIQRQAEIESLLEAAGLAIDLKDWELAQEKLSDVLKLDASHADARGKLNIVQRKKSEFEREVAANAAREKKERERAEREAKEAREKAEAEERARAQYQAEIERFLKAAELAITLKDWELAQEKLNDVLKLDSSHADARGKLDIVQRKITELEQEISAKATREKEEREWAKAEEHAWPVNAQKAHNEREEWERRKLVEDSQVVTQTRKSAWLPYGIGGGVVLAFVILVGVGYLIRQALTTEGLGIGDTMISEKDGMVMVYIPAGEFEMGDDREPGPSSPIHTVNMDAFWVDQTEVTNAMYAKCVEAGACSMPTSTASYTHESYYGNSEFADYPVINISWDDARNYCEWAGRHLPTEAEWEKAARGGLEGKLYPWGDDAPVNEKGAENSANVCENGAVVDGYFNCVISTDTEKVGSYAPNGYGLYDVAGSVWEWVDDWYDAYPGGDNTPDEFGHIYRVARGGAHNLLADDDARVAYRLPVDPTYSDETMGFRCARNALP